MNLLQQGQTEEQVLSRILASQEFYTRAQTLISTGTADERYVQALYGLLLDRTGEPDGVASWLGGLPTLGRQGVALGFLAGPTGREFRMDQFEGYYDALLHRPSDQPSLNDWVFSNLDMGSIRIAFETATRILYQRVGRRRRPRRAYLHPCMNTSPSTRSTRSSASRNVSAIFSTPRPPIGVGAPAPPARHGAMKT